MSKRVILEKIEYYYRGDSDVEKQFKLFKIFEELKVKYSDININLNDINIREEENKGWYEGDPSTYYLIFYTGDYWDT